jgi:hypothetical protein
MSRYKGKVAKEFIVRRDERIAEDNRENLDPYFQWDCEFVEWHQAKVDPFQTLYDGYEYDTTHKVLGNIDYKIYSKAGVHVSPYIQKQIIEGKIDKLGIWMWIKPYKRLELGESVEYEIIDFVDAKQALIRLEPDMKGSQRFQYPLKEIQEVNMTKALEGLRGTRMDDNWYYFNKSEK